MTNYYVRADGTAAIGAAFGPASSAAGCMSLDTLNGAGDVFSPGDVIYFSSQGGAFTDTTTVVSDASIHVLSSGDSSNQLTYRNVEGETPLFTPPASDNGVHFASGIDYVTIYGLDITSGGGGTGQAINWIRDAGGNTSGSAGEGHTIVIDSCVLTGQGASDTDAISCNENGQCIVRNTTITNFKGNASNALTVHNPNGTGASLKAYDCTITDCSSYVVSTDDGDIRTYRCTMTGTDSGAGTPAITNSGAFMGIYDGTISINNNTQGLFKTSDDAPLTQILVVQGNTINIDAMGVCESNSTEYYIDNTWYVDSTDARFNNRQNGQHFYSNRFNVRLTANAFIQNPTSLVQQLYFEGNYVTTWAPSGGVDSFIKSFNGSTLTMVVAGNVFQDFVNTCVEVQNDGVHYIGNNTFINCTNSRQLDIDATATTSTEIKANIFYNCDGSSAPILDSTAGDVVTTTAGITDYNNYSGTTTNNATTYTGDAHSTTVDPGFNLTANIDPTHFTNFIPTHADVIRAGVKWWAGANPRGYDEIIPTWTPPQGAVQEGGFGPFHPLNL